MATQMVWYGIKGHLRITYNAIGFERCVIVAYKSHLLRHLAFCFHILLRIDEWLLKYEHHL